MALRRTILNSFLKRQIVRFSGRGPCGVAPFKTIVPEGGEWRHGVHGVERFDGILVESSPDACAYAATRALLDQSPIRELVTGQPRFRLGGLAVSPRRRLFSLSDAAVAGDDAVVYCPRQRLAVAETVRQWHQPAVRHPLLASPRFPPAQPLPGLTLSLGTLDGGGFYHFLLEALPRLHLACPWLARIDHFLVNGTAGSFHERWLAAAGVPAAKIIWLSGLSHFHCEQLLFAGPFCHDSQPTPWLVRAIREVLAVPPAASPGSQRIWISRTDAGARQLAWEDDLLAALGGFTRVELTRLAPAEQIRLMAGAAVVAGPHGAGFANLVFCAPGVRSIELMPDARHRPLFGRLAGATGGEHAWAAVDFARLPANLPELAAAMRAFAR